MANPENAVERPPRLVLGSLMEPQQLITRRGGNGKWLEATEAPDRVRLTRHHDLVCDEKAYQG